MQKVLVKNLLEQMRAVVFEDNWLEVSVAGRIDALTEEQAFCQPIPQLHSVVALLAHLTGWKEEVLRRVSGEAPYLTMAHPDNWKSYAVLKTKGWMEIKNDFYTAHRALMAQLANQHDAFLQRRHGAYSYGELLNGLVHHDLYHLGQMGITIKLLS
jgi:uncharacterized damage-inducible protein DinB